MKRILMPKPVNPATQAGSTFTARRCRRNCVCTTRIVGGAGEAGSAPETARHCRAVCAAHGRHTKVAIEAITIFNDGVSNFLRTQIVESRIGRRFRQPLLVSAQHGDVALEVHLAQLLVEETLGKSQHTSRSQTRHSISCNHQHEQSRRHNAVTVLTTGGNQTQPVAKKLWVIRQARGDVVMLRLGTNRLAPNSSPPTEDHCRNISVSVWDWLVVGERKSCLD